MSTAFNSTIIKIGVYKQKAKDTRMLDFLTNNVIRKLLSLVFPLKTILTV